MHDILARVPGMIHLEMDVSSSGQLPGTGILNFPHQSRWLEPPSSVLKPSDLACTQRREQMEWFMPELLLW
jgi:hypothetical protein